MIRIILTVISTLVLLLVPGGIVTYAMYCVLTRHKTSSSIIDNDFEPVTDGYQSE